MVTARIASDFFDYSDVLIVVATVVVLDCLHLLVIVIVFDDHCCFSRMLNEQRKVTATTLCSASGTAGCGSVHYSDCFKIHRDW